MPAVGLDQDGKKGWILIHRCERCGKEVRNKAAPDDELQNGVIDGENGKS